MGICSQTYAESKTISENEISTFVDRAVNEIIGLQKSRNYKISDIKNKYELIAKVINKYFRYKYTGIKCNTNKPENRANKEIYIEYMRKVLTNAIVKSIVKYDIYNYKISRLKIFNNKAICEIILSSPDDDFTIQVLLYKINKHVYLYEYIIEGVKIVQNIHIQAYSLQSCDEFYKRIDDLIKGYEI